MRLSIRVRTIIALNVFVIGLSVVLGWIAQDVAGRVVEERFVKEMVSSASGFLKGRRFPRNDAMMGYLRQLFNAEWIAAEGAADRVVASSLSEPLIAEFRRQADEQGASGVVQLGGQAYRYDSADIDTLDDQTGLAVRGRLFMLVPDEQFQQARQRASDRVGQVIWPAALAATLLAMLLSVSITRPMRKLAREMDRLSDTRGASDEVEKMMQRGPREVSQLARSFNELLDRLDTARDRVAESERLAALGKISLSVAHELRNPLSGIKMNLRVLKDHPDLKDDPGVEAILREIDRMGLYLDELMNFSPASGVRESAAMETVTLSTLAESVLTILTGRCRHAGVSVERSFLPDEPVVRARGNQIRQVMMNLMVNAIEAMSGGGTMRLGVATVAEARRVRFSVADTGSGVPDGQTNLFEAFASGRADGVGLGLYLSKVIIERHGGTIGYHSTADGATFWFELPTTKESSTTESQRDRESGGK